MPASSSLENRTILFVDDDNDALAMLSARCQSVGMQVYTARNLLTAVRLLEKHSPDVIGVDLNMPTGSGLQFCEMLISDPETAQIPRILITGDGHDETAAAAKQLNTELISKTGNVWDRLLPILQNLLVTCPTNADEPRLESPCSTVAPQETPRAVAGIKAPAAQPAAEPTAQSKESELSLGCPLDEDQEQLLDHVFSMMGIEDEQNVVDVSADKATVPEALPWVLCIDDDVDYSDALRCRLESHGVAVRRAFDGMDGYREAYTHPASAILLDYEMPNGQGDYVLRRLKENPITANIPVIMITGVKDRTVERRIVAMGVADYLHKPVRFDVLRDSLANHIDILSSPMELI